MDAPCLTATAIICNITVVLGLNPEVPAASCGLMSCRRTHLYDNASATATQQPEITAGTI
jgi:hypothetical protein